MRIGVDVMGADNSPHAMLDALLLALKRNDLNDVIFEIYGEKTQIDNYMKNKPFDKTRVNFNYCSEIITTEDRPVEAIRTKTDSSMVRGLVDLKAGKTSAFLSAGSTGALLSGATLKVGRIKGIKRPALTVMLPTYNGTKIMLDVGANSEYTPLYLKQFAIMGHHYAKFALEKENPKTYLINIGEEAGKGPQAYQEAYKLIEETPEINFGGNLESIHLPNGHGDVIICDGFSGNLLLKLSEGFMNMFKNSLKDMIYKNISTKIGGMLLKSSLEEFKEKFSIKDKAAAPLLGISKPVMKAHGNSDTEAFLSAIVFTSKYAASDIIEKVATSL